MFAAIRAMHQRNRTVGNLYGLSRSLADAHVTGEVAAYPNIKPSDLAKRLGLSPVATARVLKSAQAAGLIRSKPDDKDGRAKRLQLGPRAEKLLAQNLERNVATFGAAYERLSTQGRRRFQTYLAQFCDGWLAPPAAVTSEDPPLMAEIRRLTRALGLLADRLSFAPWCTPLKWHVLTMARDQGQTGISALVIGTSLAASPKVIADLLRVLKADGLVRCGRKKTVTLTVFITEKGRAVLDELEQAACTEFDRCLKNLSTEQISEFATLWEHYGGKFVTPLVQAITKGTVLECVEKPAARAQARVFIVEQRVRQKLLEDLPATIIADKSVVFVLYRFKNPTLAVELVETEPRIWTAANFVIEPNQISSNTIRQLIPIFLQNALLITSASQIHFQRQHTSRAIWSLLSGKSHGENRLSVSLASDSPQILK